MGHSEKTQLFFGARLTEEQSEKARIASLYKLRVTTLGDLTSSKTQDFLACCWTELTVESKPLALDSMPVVPVAARERLSAMLEDFGVTEEPRWWLGAVGG